MGDGVVYVFGRRDDRGGVSEVRFEDVGVGRYADIGGGVGDGYCFYGCDLRIARFGGGGEDGEGEGEDGGDEAFCYQEAPEEVSPVG